MPLYQKKVPLKQGLCGSYDGEVARGTWWGVERQLAANLHQHDVLAAAAPGGAHGGGQDSNTTTTHHTPHTTHQHHHHNHHNRKHSPPESLSWYPGSVSQSSLQTIPLHCSPTNLNLSNTVIKVPNLKYLSSLTEVSMILKYIFRCASIYSPQVVSQSVSQSPSHNFQPSCWGTGSLKQVKSGQLRFWTVTVLDRHPCYSCHPCHPCHPYCPHHLVNPVNF